MDFSPIGIIRQLREHGQDGRHAKALGKTSQEDAAEKDCGAPGKMPQKYYEQRQAARSFRHG